MHGSLAMTAELISGVSDGLKQLANRQPGFDVLVCPPSPYLAVTQAAIADSTIQLGAQNVSAEVQGAFTGEISLPMLNEFGCSYVLLGHSERRELFGETDQQIAEKFAACIASETEIIPVLCIGETLKQRQSGATEQVIANQLDAVLETAGINGFNKAVIAYEPVWAIGTGETATPQQAQDAHQFIRNKLAKLDSAVADKVQVLYGGSMKPGNAEELMAQTDIDGGLIGGAALDANSFAAICTAANKLST